MDPARQAARALSRPATDPWHAECIVPVIMKTQRPAFSKIEKYFFGALMAPLGLAMLAFAVGG